jgi:type I restriction enzyme, S subunit
MARLGNYIRQECHPLGSSGTQNLRLIGVSNGHGLHASSRDSSDDISRYQRVEKNWFAYNPMRVNVGSIGLADDDSKTGYTSPDYTVFSCREGLDPQFLLHFLKSDYGLEAIVRNCSGAVRKRLYYGGLAEIELPIPNIEDQEALVTRINSIRQAVQFIRDRNSDSYELPQLKQAILVQAIRGKLTADWRDAHPQAQLGSDLLRRIQAQKAQLIASKKLRPEKPMPKLASAKMSIEYPKEWALGRLGDIAQVVRGGSPRPAGDPRFYGGDIPFLKVADLTNDDEIYVQGHTYTINSAGLSKTRFVDEELVLVTNSGATLGVPKILNFPSAFNDGIAAFLCLPEAIDKKFLYYLLKAKTAWFLAEVSKGIGQPNLNTDLIKQTPVAIPPLAEQTVIVERVTVLLALCRSLDKQIEKSRLDAAKLLQAVLRDVFAPPQEGRASLAPTLLLEKACERFNLAL